MKRPPATFYQPLFDHMADYHNLPLTDSEMDEIMRICRELEEKAREQEAERELNRRSLDR